MTEIFLKIMDMSISASWLILAVLAFRVVFTKMPKWVNVLLWGIVAVRLICPFSIESSVSLIPDSIGNGELVSEWADDYIGGVDIHYPGSVYYDAAVGAGREPIYDGEGGYYVVTKHDQLGEPSTVKNTVIPVLSALWASGMAVLALYTVISYWRLRRKVSEAVILRENIFQSENVGSPFVLGIIKPKIYLPYNMDDQGMEHVVTHEQAHIRRKDHLWKPLGFLLLTTHWLNPLIWLAYVLLCRDIELACDEKVIRDLGNEQRADYSQALVACSVNRRMIAACPLAFGEVGIKERVQSVLNYRKPAFRVIVVSVIACAVVAMCFLTNPVGFRFDRASNIIVSANHFDMRSADEASAVEMNLAQIGELSSRLSGVRKTKRSDKYGGLTPGYQISALLQDGTYIRISGYSLSDNDMVDIEWNDERYVVSDGEFQDYLSRVCAAGDKTAAVGAVAGKTYLYEKEGIIGSFTITIYDDGTFSYYEGMASSYLGFGSWKQEGNAITMTDDGHDGMRLVNHFKLDGDDLVFVGDGSSNFIYVKVQDEERFRCTGEAFKPNSGVDESDLELQANTISVIGTSFADLNESSNYIKSIQVSDETCTIRLAPNNYGHIEDAVVYAGEFGKIFLSKVVPVGNTLEFRFRAHGIIGAEKATIITASAFQDNGFLNSQINIAPDAEMVAKYSLQTSELEEWGNYFSIIVLVNDDTPIELTLQNLLVVEFREK